VTEAESEDAMTVEIEVAIGIETGVKVLDGIEILVVDIEVEAPVQVVVAVHTEDVMTARIAEIDLVAIWIETVRETMKKIKAMN
jgi:hypothetical protein